MKAADERIASLHRILQSAVPLSWHFPSKADQVLNACYYYQRQVIVRLSFYKRGRNTAGLRTKKISVHLLKKIHTKSVKFEYLK